MIERQQATLQVYCALVANPSRYRKIEHEVRRGTLSQKDATLKNWKKAELIIADLEKAGKLTFEDGPEYLNVTISNLGD